MLLCCKHPIFDPTAAAAGSEHYSGIIPDLFPDLPNPLPWYLRRTPMLTWATLLVAPVLSEWAGQ